MRTFLAAAASVALLAGCATESSTSNNSTRTASANERDDSLGNGISAVRRGDYARAEATLAAELKNDPNDPYANLNMGVLRAIQDRRDEALAFYQRAIENGEEAPINRTVTANGSVLAETTTVANVARENISRLQ